MVRASPSTSDRKTLPKDAKGLAAKWRVVKNSEQQVPIIELTASQCSNRPAWSNAWLTTSCSRVLPLACVDQQSLAFDRREFGVLGWTAAPDWQESYEFSISLPQSGRCRCRQTGSNVAMKSRGGVPALSSGTKVFRQAPQSRAHRSVAHCASSSR
jgi:hypothetical protein